MTNMFAVLTDRTWGHVFVLGVFQIEPSDITSTLPMRVVASKDITIVLPDRAIVFGCRVFLPWGRPAGVADLSAPVRDLTAPLPDLTSVFADLSSMTGIHGPA